MSREVDPVMTECLEKARALLLQAVTVGEPEYEGGYYDYPAIATIAVALYQERMREKEQLSSLEIAMIREQPPEFIA